MITNLSIGRYGRFGNQLFQIAGAIGIAKANGHEFGFQPWINHDHKERFGSTEDVDLQKYFVNELPGLGYNHPNDFREIPYQWGYEEHFFGAGLWNITGHFQSEKYFKHCIDEVRHYFKMKADGKINFYSNTVAIHVRRGDYDNRYHTLIDISYYKKAINNWPRNTNFLLFSDEIDKSMSLFSELRVPFLQYVRGKDYIDEFCAMKQCGGFICANSSYSLMAAILSEAPNKKIVCPSNWFGPAWNPETKDLYPEGAIVI